MNIENTETPEEMAAFFDARAAGYDDHMRSVVFTDTEFVQFYQAVSASIEKTDEPLEILDIGCGTGLELEALFQRAPNAMVTGIDLSEAMLARLRERYRPRMDQITVIADSYLTMPFGNHTYDHIISVMSLHHLLHDKKRALYRKVRAALKPGGAYIEGDSVTYPAMEAQFLAEYHQQVAPMRKRFGDMPRTEDGYYHIDIPFSLDTQRSLLLEAGFKNFDVVWQKDHAVVWNAAVYVVTA